ncbi:cupin domain-containing protein [Candidatus Purcelliella pentastirinorum]|nr:cupin domain-containing protein [Candidatus Purcelliella pentastirinorum]
MKLISRRNFMKLAASGAIAISTTNKINAKSLLSDLNTPRGGSDPGPHNELRDQENPDIINPPLTDKGTLPNLRFSFSDSHIRNESGGWTRQITQRELTVSKTISGVNMRLNTGGIRELHWHKEAEWAYMLYGNAQITAMDTNGKFFIDNIKTDDLWYFPPGIPHSIQGLIPDGCEFILAFDNGNFDEDSTFLLSDWFKHTPTDILSKNFQISKKNFNILPKPEEKYIFQGTKNKIKYNINKKYISKKKFSYKMSVKKAIKFKKGKIKIADTSNFKISKNISAALVELKKGAIRELHWHPNNDEWQYYIIGKAKMGVFASSDTARTFDMKAGDVGYIPFAMGHYIENIGNETLKFLEIFKSSYYADISLKQWLSLTPEQLIQDHLNLNSNFKKSLNKEKTPII